MSYWQGFLATLFCLQNCDRSYMRKEFFAEFIPFIRIDETDIIVPLIYFGIIISGRSKDDFLIKIMSGIFFYMIFYFF